MLYLVVSTPHPARPKDIKGARGEWWPWVENLKSKGKAICYYARVGRGATAIFDVSSNEELHEFLTQWTNIVPVMFDIYPLVGSEQAQQLLK
jgi:muconolactone delta-isomerase